jgi:hypothetical protein
VSSANIAPIGQISRRYHHQTLPSAWRAEPSILHPDGWSVIGPAGYAVRRLWGNGGRNIGKPNPLRNRFFQKSLLGIGRSKKSSKSPAFGPFHRFSERKLPQRRCQAGKAILEISWQRCSAFQRSLQTERPPSLDVRRSMLDVRCSMFDPPGALSFAPESQSGISPARLLPSPQLLPLWIHRSCFRKPLTKKAYAKTK